MRQHRQRSGVEPRGQVLEWARDALADQLTHAEHGPVVLVSHDIVNRGRLTERGLYRTLSRMVDQGLLEAESVDAARIGAKRKVFELTALGKRYLAEITEEFVTP